MESNASFLLQGGTYYFHVSNPTLWYFYLLIGDLLLWIFHYFQKAMARIDASQTTLASAPVLLRALCRF